MLTVLLFCSFFSYFFTSLEGIFLLILKIWQNPKPKRNISFLPNDIGLPWIINNIQKYERDILVCFRYLHHLWCKKTFKLMPPHLLAKNLRRMLQVASQLWWLKETEMLAKCFPPSQHNFWIHCAKWVLCVELTTKRYLNIYS